MARSSKLVKPAHQQLVHLRVLRSQQLSPHWMRVTVGGAEIEKFAPMGYDQWFRLFLPVGSSTAIERIPEKANTLIGYLRYLRIPAGVRPVMRNYSVRAFRAADEQTGAAAEIDIDFVLHGSAEHGTAGPAATWARTCTVGESVVIIDEGIAFNPARGVDRVLLVADETGLPAIAGICGSLPGSARGVAILEVPTADDALEFEHPTGIEVRWLVRDRGVRPGSSALAELTSEQSVPNDVHAYIVGEQGLVVGARRLLVAERGIDKSQVSFTGYWKLGVGSV